MPSKLHNLFRTLTWSDFPRANKPEPGPGEFVHGAQCKTDIVPSGFALDKVGSLFRIRDSIDVKIEYKRNESWVANWIFNQSKVFQDELLNHEQGHYNIAALFGRDFFLALMQLKPKTYANAAAAQQDLDKVQRDIALKAQPAQDRYDTDTKNGNKPEEQKRWDGFIKSAFTTPATPPQQTPDGVAIKVTLLSVLAKNGIKL